MAFTEFLINKRGRLSWVDETAFATGGTMTSGEVCGLNATIEPDFTPNWIEILTAGTDTRSVEDRVVGPLDLPFTLTFTPVNWKFLKYLGYGVADAGGPTYTHTMTLANTIQSFKLEWAFRHSTPLVVTLAGCFCTGGTISFQKATGEGNEGNIQVSLRCYARSYTIGSSVSSLSAISRSPFQWRHTRATINSSIITEVNNGEMVIETGIDVNASRYCNDTEDVYISEPILGTQRITGRININLKDNTHLSLFDTMAEISNCSLDFIRNATNNKVEADFSGFRYHKAFPPLGLEGVSAVDIPFSAESFATLIATDTIATY